MHSRKSFYGAIPNSHRRITVNNVAIFPLQVTVLVRSLHYPETFFPLNCGIVKCSVGKKVKFLYLYYWNGEPGCWIRYISTDRWPQRSKFSYRCFNFQRIDIVAVTTMDQVWIGKEIFFICVDSGLSLSRHRIRTLFPSSVALLIGTPPNIPLSRAWNQLTSHYMH